MANHETTLCACGCQQLCLPGKHSPHKRYIQGHYARVRPPQQSRPLEERFWERVNKTDTCWLWTGSTNNRGYGSIVTHGHANSVGAHRVSYELHYGPIPAGVHCLHHCDNPGCVRPDHLFLGTNKDNIQDAMRKGRKKHQGGNTHPRGEKHHKAKLTEEQVRAIRALYATRQHSQKTLAQIFNVSSSLIYFIVTRKIWEHIK